MNWKQSFKKAKDNTIPLDVFYKRLPSRATYTPNEVIQGMRGYDAKEVLDSLEKHGCIIWGGRLVVFTKHPIKTYKKKKR